MDGDKLWRRIAGAGALRLMDRTSCSAESTFIYRGWGKEIFQIVVELVYAGSQFVHGTMESARTAAGTISYEFLYRCADKIGEASEALTRTNLPVDAKLVFSDPDTDESRFRF